MIGGKDRVGMHGAVLKSLTFPDRLRDVEGKTAK
jgi:hypothetical protein